MPSNYVIVFISKQYVIFIQCIYYIRSPPDDDSSDEDEEQVPSPGGKQMRRGMGKQLRAPSPQRDGDDRRQRSCVVDNIEACCVKQLVSQGGKAMRSLTFVQLRNQ